MRLLVPKFVIPITAWGVLSLLAVVIALASVPSANAQAFTHIFKGQVNLNGRPAPDGTVVSAVLRSVGTVAQAKVSRGQFRLEIHQPTGEGFEGAIVEFRVQIEGGRTLPFPQTSHWTSGGGTIINLDLRNASFPLNPEPPPQSGGPHVFQGKVIHNGRPAQDGTRVNAFVDGVRIVGTGTRGGVFRLAVAPPIDRSFIGKFVEFRGRTPDGRGFRWHESYRWQPGAVTNVAIELGGGGGRLPGPSLSDPGAPSIECVVRVLGRVPRGFEDISPGDQMRIAQECMGFGAGGPGTQDIDQERARLELERTLQKEQQALDKARLEAERELQEAQASLEQQRLKRDRAMQEEQARLEQERLKQDRIRQEEQDRLDRERVRRDQERFQREQERQRELDQARFEQEQQRLMRQQELDQQQQKLEEERRARQRRQEEGDFKAEQERLRREVELNLQRQKFELEQRTRQQLGLPV